MWIWFTPSPPIKHLKSLQVSAFFSRTAYLPHRTPHLAREAAKGLRSPALSRPVTIPYCVSARVALRHTRENKQIVLVGDTGSEQLLHLRFTGLHLAKNERPTPPRCSFGLKLTQATLNDADHTITPGSTLSNPLWNRHSTDWGEHPVALSGLTPREERIDDRIEAERARAA